MAVYATLCELGYEKETIVSIFPKLIPPPGRLKYSEDQKTELVLWIMPILLMDWKNYYWPPKI